MDLKIIKKIAYDLMGKKEVIQVKKRVINITFIIVRKVKQ